VRLSETKGKVVQDKGGGFSISPFDEDIPF
jgi:hypothetical protein